MSTRAAAILARSKALGHTESVTPRPRGAAAGARDALVERLAEENDGGRTASPRIRLTLLNDAATGILATAAADDLIVDVAAFRGGTAAGRKVRRLDPERTDAEWTVLDVL